MTDEHSIQQQLGKLAALRDAIAQVIVGQAGVVEQLLIGLLAGGHCLIEGVPGLGKTLLVQAIAKAIESHPNVIKLVELLTMHLAPKQILINAHINLRDDLVTGEIVQTIEDIEALIKQAEPKVEMIFLETARQSDTDEQECVSEHVG